MAVYKGDTHIVTGTADEVAEFLGISIEHTLYLTYPTNHQRNKGGKRRVAFYVDDSPLADKQHDFLLTVCRLYEKENRPLQLIETGIEAGYDRVIASSIASRRYGTLLKYGYVKRSEEKYVSYIPTEMGIQYCEDFALEEAQ